eukprot:5081340-Amphidinium_carterae.1
MVCFTTGTNVEIRANQNEERYKGVQSIWNYCQGAPAWGREKTITRVGSDVHSVTANKVDKKRFLQHVNGVH